MVVGYIIAASKTYFKLEETLYHVTHSYSKLAMNVVEVPNNLRYKLQGMLIEKSITTEA